MSGVVGKETRGEELTKWDKRQLATMRTLLNAALYQLELVDDREDRDDRERQLRYALAQGFVRRAGRLMRLAEKRTAVRRGVSVVLSPSTKNQETPDAG